MMMSFERPRPLRCAPQMGLVKNQYPPSKLSPLAVKDEWLLIHYGCFFVHDTVKI